VEAVVVPIGGTKLTVEDSIITRPIRRWPTDTRQNSLTIPIHTVGFNLLEVIGFNESLVEKRCIVLAPSFLAAECTTCGNGAVLCGRGTNNNSNFTTNVVRFIESRLAVEAKAKQTTAHQRSVGELKSSGVRKVQ
jgi:hypothetical protein